MDGGLHFLSGQSVAHLSSQLCAEHWEVKEHQLWAQVWDILQCGSLPSITEAWLSTEMREPSRMKTLRDLRQ